MSRLPAIARGARTNVALLVPTAGSFITQTGSMGLLADEHRAGAADLATRFGHADPCLV